MPRPPAVPCTRHVAPRGCWRWVPATPPHGRPAAAIWRLGGERKAGGRRGAGRPGALRHRAFWRSCDPLLSVRPPVAGRIAPGRLGAVHLSLSALRGLVTNPSSPSQVPPVLRLPYCGHCPSWNPFLPCGYRITATAQAGIGLDLTGPHPALRLRPKLDFARDLPGHLPALRLPPKLESLSPC